MPALLNTAGCGAEHCQTPMSHQTGQRCLTRCLTRGVENISMVTNPADLQLWVSLFPATLKSGATRGSQTPTDHIGHGFFAQFTVRLQEFWCFYLHNSVQVLSRCGHGAGVDRRAHGHHGDMMMGVLSKCGGRNDDRGVVGRCWGSRGLRT